MAGEDDLRARFNPLDWILAARPKWRTIPESTVTPPATPENPDPEPIVTPERTEAYTDPGDLPDEVASGAELSLGGQIALVQAALAQQVDKRIRVAIGRRSLTNGVPLLAGATANLTVTFDTEALDVPEPGWVQIQPAIAWMGKTTAIVVPGTVTTEGCTVRVTALDVVVPDSSNPITYEAVCPYLYVEPFEPEE